MAVLLKCLAVKPRGRPTCKVRTLFDSAGIRKVALLDFDVHHGNGTQACIRNTVPSLATHTFETPYSKGLQEFPVWKPWLDSNDAENIFFARSLLCSPTLANNKKSSLHAPACSAQDLRPCYRAHQMG